MMRPLFAVAAALVLAATSVAQDVPARFGILHNPDLYRQDTPQDALRSAVAAVGRERYDYLAAHLLDPEWVDARLATNQAYFERVAGEQVVATAAGAQLRGPALQARVQEVGTRLNFQELAGQIRRKLADQPDNLKDLRRFLREGEGEFKPSAETAVAVLKDARDRALYFKKVKDRWFLENRKDEAAAPPPKEKE